MVVRKRKSEQKRRLPSNCAWPSSSSLLRQLIPLLVETGVLSINNVSLRQQIVEPEFLGRITSARRFLTFCVAPAGAVLGGWLGSVIGLGPTLLVATGVLALGVAVVMWWSPIRHAR